MGQAHTKICRLTESLGKDFYAVKGAVRLSDSGQYFHALRACCVGILGKQEANRFANFATILDVIQTCERTIEALRRQIQNRIEKMTDTLFSDYYTTSTGTWHFSITLPDHRLCSDRILDTKLRLLRNH